MIEIAGAPAVLMLVGAIISAVGALWAAQQQATSERELRQKSDEIAELNKQIALSITGGDSFAYLIPIRLGVSTSSLAIIHRGEYPLYDLTLRVVDLEKWKARDRQKPISFFDMQRDEIRLDIGNVAANQARVVGPMQIDSDSLRWNIFFSARNGFYTQLLRLKRINGELKTALKVTRNLPSGEAETLQIDPAYPLGNDGKVEWE